METINERIFRLLGKEHGVQKKLADHLNKPGRPFSNKTITAWKKRSSKIPSEYIPDIADFLGVSVNYLLGNEEESVVSTESEKISSTKHEKYIQNPSSKYLQKIAEYLNVSGLYLQTEDGYGGFFSRNEIDFLLRYRNLSETSKKMINAIMVISENDHA